MAEAGPGQTIRFSVFEADLKTGELRKNGVKIKLQQQPFQVLSVLLRNPGQIVTREDLRQELWPNDTFVDFDHSLNAAIARLRDALGESADRPVFVETLARRGYRFNPPLLAPPSNAPEMATPSPAVSPSSFTRARIAMGAIVLFAVLVATAFAVARLNRRPLSAASRVRSIAVLPLENLSHDPQQEYFSDGMTSAIINSLSDIQELRIISRTSSERYKGTTKSLPQIARELDVDAVMEGSVLRAGSRVRINVELIDAASDKHLWSESYERELGDVLRLHSELARAVADRVHIQLQTNQANGLRSAPAVNQSAYEDYLQARRYSTGGASRAEYRLAQQYLEKSVKEDPNFALAYVGLAEVYLSLGTLRDMPPDEASRNGRVYIQKALRLDPSLSEAHDALGYLYWQYEWNPELAEAEFRKSLQRNPSNMDARESYAWFLSWSGRRDDAIGQIELMRKLDPAFPLRCNDEAGMHYHLREYDGLVKSGQQGIELNPTDWSSHYFLGVGYFNTGKRSEAIGELQKAAEFSDNDMDVLAALAYAYSSVGKRYNAQKILETLQRKSKASYISPYMVAVIFAGLSDKAQAFAYLEKAYTEKSTDLLYFLKADFRLDGLRSDSRFMDLASRVAGRSH
jgi:TolB-like protein/DNA-binding winged helix-turn-helix (wHTH) protein/Tfp pilus assembly protein PilF